MQAFDYVRPTTVDEAVSILARHGDQARVLSGGTDLIVALRESRRQVQVVVDIKALSETAELAYSPQAGLRLGAAVPCYRIYGDSAVAAAYPGLIDAARLIGGIQIQGRQHRRQHLQRLPCRRPRACADRSRRDLCHRRAARTAKSP